MTRNGSGVRSEAVLRSLLRRRFGHWFLPLGINQAEADAVRTSGSDLRLWTAGDRGLLFMPAPPPLSRDRKARPARLGSANARLKILRALPLRQKIALSLRVIDALLESTDNVAVAFSGGRDSLVALHLVLRRRPDALVLFTNTTIEFPETVKFVHRLVDEWHLNYRELRPDRNFWELSRERGLPIGGRGNDFFLRELSEASGVKLSNACCNQLKITPARRFYRQNGVEGVVTGLRADESLIRRLNFADYGALRFSSDYGALVSWPLFAWQVPDLRAYIDAYHLPINPLYDMGRDRVGCWACMQDFLHEDSGLIALRRTHPGMYATMKKQFGPELLRVLTAWGEVQHRGFTMDNFDELYTPCGLDLLRPPRRQPTPGEVEAPSDNLPGDE